MTRLSDVGIAHDGGLSGLTPGLARALIRTLTKGTALGHGARHIHVGHARWLAAQQELLAEIAEDGHPDTKFVRGAYGAGKSHFLSVVQDGARTNNWITAHVECKADGVQIDRFETLYPKLTAKIDAADIAAVRADNEYGIDPIRHLLERWAKRMLAQAGVREGGLVRPFDAEDRLYVQLESGLLRSPLAPDFTKALSAFARGQLAKDFATTTAVCNWLRGGTERARLPIQYVRRPALGPVAGGQMVDIRPISRGTVREIMRGFLWLVRAAGYAGMVLCIDEIEELAKLGNRRRQDQALQALREYVDSASGDADYRHLCMYLAATPDMFEGPSYFPRYDALVTRIQSFGPEVNWRAPVIDLDRTPLGPNEMREVAFKIVRVHRVAYGASAVDALAPDVIERFVTGVVSSKFAVAKPRLLARLLVDELERARQADLTSYTLPADVDELVATSAKSIKRDVDA